MKFIVSCSECPPVIADEAEVRNAVHSMFCTCDRPNKCDNEYLADFDASDPNQFTENGAQWDLEDGWVKIEPMEDK